MKFGIPSLVATIGTQFFWRGAVLVLSQGKSGTLVYVKESFLYPALVGKIGGVFPAQMLWLILIAILGWILLNRHKFGAHIYLIGDNIKSAELMGVNTGRTRILAFMLIGLVSAFAGVIASFHVVYFWPSLGDGKLLPHTRFGVPGRHFRLWRYRHHPGHVPGGIHHRRHRSRDGRRWAYGLLDPADIRIDHRALGDHAHVPAQAGHLISPDSQPARSSIPLLQHQYR